MHPYDLGMAINTCSTPDITGIPPTLSSHRRHNSTELLPDAWLDYGSDDPLEAHRWISACTACGAAPSLALVNLTPMVRCVCGASGRPGRLSVHAVASWNTSPMSQPRSYRDLPFFHVGEMSPLSARSHLSALQAHLTRELAKTRGRIARKLPVTELYQYTLEAYLAWASHGLDLIAVEMSHGGTPTNTSSPAECLAA